MMGAWTRSAIVWEIFITLKYERAESCSFCVTGAGKFGVFVAEATSMSEGMIRLPDLGDDRWEYHEKAGIIKGTSTGKVFKIGDSIDIKIKTVDTERKLIDYVLVIDGVSQESKRHQPKVRRGYRRGRSKPRS